VSRISELVVGCWTCNKQLAGSAAGD